MLTGALLGLMEQIALDIVTLTELSEEREFFESRLTYARTLHLLGMLAKTCGNVPVESRLRMPQVDWPAWQSLGRALAQPERHRLQIWVAVKELTPMTLYRLQGYKRSQPQLFSMVM